MATAAASQPFLDLSQGASENDSQEELVCFGKFRTQIVGIRYYTGQHTIGKNEMVQMVREAENPYDRWAIRVDNIRGEKVGHLKREQVLHLSPLYDQGLVKFEGVVPGPTTNTYTMPIDVYCFGPPQHQQLVSQRMRSGYMFLDSAPELEEGGAGSASQQLAGAARLSVAQMEQSLERLFEELHDPEKPSEMMEPTAEVTSPLFPHQQQALAWMVRRENSSSLPPFWEPHLLPGATAQTLKYCNTLTNYIDNSRPLPMRGGILADDMGLGKTLAVISLIATNRPGAVLPATRLGTAAGEIPDEPPAKKRRGAGSQIEKAKAKAKTKAQQLLEAAEPPPQPPAAGGPRGTLIVCPLSVLSNWQQQLQEHTAGNLQVCVYHGPDRNRGVAHLSQYDVVLTTYQILAQDLGAPGNCGLLRVPWLRVVLDEAHNIKNAGTQQARAAAALKAERQWAVTGTPIQNNLKDLYGLLAFLRLDPLHERQFFTRALERPVKNREAKGFKSLQVLMGSIALRRTKDMQVGGRPIVALPPKTVHIVHVELKGEERRRYERLEIAGRQVISRHIAANDLLRNYTGVLEIILRLRQICDDSSLVPEAQLEAAAAAGAAAQAGQAPPPANAAELAAKLGALLAAGGDDDCPICLNALDLPVITACAHVYCRRCIEAVILQQKPACPLCRAPVSMQHLIDPPPQQQQEQQQPAAASHPTPTSAKIAALMQRLNLATAQGIKSVVFSQFTGMLGKVEAALVAAGLSYCRLDGSSSAKARAEMVRGFASAGGPSVFLVSLKAGGVGMNLVAASHVHLLDPWWNPSVEEQAMDRVHRLGQCRGVEVFRYICSATIEERMLQLQERKRELGRAAFDRRSAEQLQRMRIDDIRLLMEL